jgi:hypothetical protein
VALLWIKLTLWHNFSSYALVPSFAQSPTIRLKIAA